MRRWVLFVGLSVAPRWAWAGPCDPFVEKMTGYVAEAHASVASFLSRPATEPSRSIRAELKAACDRVGPDVRACVEASVERSGVERCLGSDPLVWWTWDTAWQKVAGTPPDSLGLGHTKEVRGEGFRFRVPVSAVPTDDGWLYSYEDLGQGRTANLRVTIGTPIPPIEALQEAAGAEWKSAVRVDYRSVKAERADGQVQWVVQARSAAEGGLGVAECIGPRRDTDMLRALCDGLAVEVPPRSARAVALPRTGLEVDTVLGAPVRWEVRPGQFTALWHARGEVGDVVLSVWRQGAEQPLEVREPPITRVEERWTRGTMVLESWAGSDLVVRTQFKVGDQSYRASCEGMVQEEVFLRELCTSITAATPEGAREQERVWWGLETAPVPAEGIRRWLPGQDVALETSHPLSGEFPGRAEFGDLVVFAQVVDPVAKPLDGAWVHGVIEPVPRPPPHRRGQPKFDNVKAAEGTYVARVVGESGTPHAQALVTGDTTWLYLTCFHPTRDVAEQACASARPATDADRARTIADALLPAYGW